MTAQDLKNAILQLAVQGKLVPQDPADEPASELLKRIKAEKERLIKEGKIKREKALAPITEEEIPFEIPENWIWVRLGEITTLNGGYAFKSTNYASSGVRVIRISDFNENGIINKNMVYHPFYEELREFIIEDNDILMCMTGGTVGKSCIIKKLNDICVLNQRVARIRFLTNIVNFGYLVLTSPQIQDIININKTSTNDNISMELIKSFLIPLPPLAEQERIVAKIEELMPLVEEYGKAEERLTALNAEFPDKLRKSILQQAIQGKLTERDPADEPASELLKRIRAEKERLIKEGKIKKDRRTEELGVPSAENITFDIPIGWECIYLGSILNKLTDGTHKTPKYTNSGVKFVSVKDMSNGVLSLEKTKYISEKEHNELYLRCSYFIMMMLIINMRAIWAFFKRLDLRKAKLPAKPPEVEPIFL